MEARTLYIRTIEHQNKAMKNQLKTISDLGKDSTNEDVKTLATLAQLMLDKVRKVNP